MTEIKLRSGNYKYPATMWEKGERLYFKFDYNPGLITEIKSMQGARWDPTNKCWHVENSQRNHFQLAYLTGANPYAPYDQKIEPFKLEERSGKRLFNHQRMMISHMIVRKRCIVAGEMGTGKTLAAIITMEQAPGNWWYVAPRATIYAIQRELKVWNSTAQPTFYTYEALTKKAKAWQPGDLVPDGIVLDESSKIKTPTSQRSQAASAFANLIREKDGYVILMSGSPAPKAPSDWWMQSEVACPGFIKEGDIHKFRNRLAVIVQKENIMAGGVYPELVTWKDNPLKCNKCGKFKNDPIHLLELCQADYHEFIESKNEISYLYERLKGLTVVYFKKDCLDLPEKYYRVVRIEPSAAITRAAKTIAKTAATTIEGLTRLRELSDGFQYIETKSGEVKCDLCQGSGETKQKTEVEGSCPNCPVPQEDSSGDLECLNHQPTYIDSVDKCPKCKGKGVVDTYKRETKRVDCPKDQVIVDYLDEHEDVGRIVIYAAFSGSIDRVVDVCCKQGWHVIRVDQGKNIFMNEKGQPIQCENFLNVFQDQKDEYPRVAFVAHPGSAGMGLTLTASPTIVYYSNTFNAEERIQSEDRIHRPGMDINRGATIVDIVHLPSDEKVLANLKKKRDLQSLTLGDFINDGERKD